MKYLILSALVAVAAADSDVASYTPAQPITNSYARGGSVDYYAKPDYNYGYSVKDAYSGVDIDAHENRYGHQTQGSYGTSLPDGRRQKVDYYVDGKSGYNANVEYYGVAHHPKTPINYYNRGNYYNQGYGSQISRGYNGRFGNFGFNGLGLSGGLAGGFRGLRAGGLRGYGGRSGFRGRYRTGRGRYFGAGYGK